MSDTALPTALNRPGLVRAYATRFRGYEDPIREGGIWLNGAADGIAWTDVLCRDGLAYGALSRMNAAERRAEQGNLAGSSVLAAEPEGDYDDPTAVLTGQWGTNQHVAADVFTRNQTTELFQEVQIRLRHTMTPAHCTGYEIIWRCLAGDGAYIEIVRWNGPVGDFTSLARLVGADCSIKDGDRIDGSIVGSQITAATNGVTLLTASDDAFPAGAPGFGFNFGVGSTNVDHGLTSFAAETYES